MGTLPLEKHISGTISIYRIGISFLCWLTVLVIIALQVSFLAIASIAIRQIFYSFGLDKLYIANYIFIICLVIFEDFSRIAAISIKYVKLNRLRSYVIVSALVFSVVETASLFRAMNIYYMHAAAEIYCVSVLFLIIKFIGHSYITYNLFVAKERKLRFLIVALIIGHIVFDVLAMYVENTVGVSRFAVLCMVALSTLYILLSALVYRAISRPRDIELGKMLTIKYQALSEK